jgi:undecaprenyl-diphosphatase
LLEKLDQIDRSVFLFLNGLNSDPLDVVMFWGTRGLVWLPLFLFLLYLTIRTFKWQTLWILLFTAILIGISDQLSVFFKEWIARPRPTHNTGVTGIHIVNGYTGGQFGFYSSHASTTMAVAVFLVLMMKSRFPFLLPLMLFWAVFMSYTRIYLGVHYPGDILVGILIGAAIGYTGALVCKGFLRKNPWGRP